MSTFKYYMLLNIEQHERLVRVAWLVTITIDPYQESLKSVQSQCAKLCRQSHLLAGKHGLIICMITYNPIEQMPFIEHQEIKSNRGKSNHAVPSCSDSRLTVELAVKQGDRLQGLTCVFACASSSLCPLTSGFGRGGSEVSEL